MRRFRFHLGTLVIVVLILGISFAALRESNEVWDSAIFTLTLVILLTSVLLAVHRTEKRRAFWIGFALFGGSYLTLSLVPSIESRLVTTKAMAYLDSKVPGEPRALHDPGHGDHLWNPRNQVQAVAFSPQGNQLAISSLGTVRLWDAKTDRLLGGWAGTTENFVWIGHSLFALLAGWFGGLLSRRIWRASRPSEPETVGLS